MMGEDKSNNLDNINNTEELKATELEEQYLKSFQSIEEGQTVTGTVIQIDNETVFIDIGYKSEGKIPLLEFANVPKIGDKVKVVILRMEGNEGSIIVSKRKADEKEFWNNLKKAFTDKLPVEGKIVRAIKSGYDVDLGYGVHGFLPISKVDVKRVEDTDKEKDKYVGYTSLFKIERLFSDNKTNIVLSRKGWLENENRQKRKTFFETTAIGDEVEGFVKSFASFGAFIDLGGFDGLLHINDMSWGHVTSPKEVVQPGEKLKLKVIHLDEEQNRINLSLKHFRDDPWSRFEEKYHIDDKVKGKVTKLTNFGAFVELEEGVEGLVHVSELSWVKKVKHPKEVLNIGDEVEVKILSYDVAQGKVSLGLKQVVANPWDVIDEKYPEGMRLKRPVKNISNFGAFFELEEGIDGLLHLDDLSWTKHYKHPSELLKVGEEVEVMVIEVDKKNHKIRLGLKQIQEDPWMSLKRAFPKGSVIEGEIASIKDAGVVVKVQGDVEGFIPKINLYDADSENIDDVLKQLKEGDKIKAKIVEVFPKKQKLTLSRKDYLKQLNQEEIAKYIHDDSADETVSIGDFLKKDQT